MGIADLFFSFRGRIGRGRFWLAQIVNLLAFAIVVVVIATNLRGSGSLLLMLAAFAVFKYVDFAISAKRWHDRGRSGWWSLILFAPLVGPFWYLIEVGLVRGQSGPNDYGPDPRGGGGEAGSSSFAYQALISSNYPLEFRGADPGPAFVSRHGGTDLPASSRPSSAVRGGGRSSFGRRGL